MTVEVFYIALIGALLWLHMRASERWDAERARLLAALTAPSPIAAHAALSTPAPAKDPAATEAVVSRRVPIGEG